MFKTNESGRSMVEMLAVLAIGGVITIGGLSGFRAAMNKLRANEISSLVAEASIYAQTHNRTTTFNDLEGMEEREIPCVVSSKAFSNGRVVVEFEDSSTCQNIHNYVSTSFDSCKWIHESATKGCYTNAGGECDGGTCTCDVKSCPS